MDTMVTRSRAYENKRCERCERCERQGEAETKVTSFYTMSSSLSVVNRGEVKERERDLYAGKSKRNTQDTMLLLPRKINKGWGGLGTCRETQNK